MRYAVLLAAVCAIIPAQAQWATYDYVVVGAGTSGMTLAARLSEDPSVTVAVIEAGDDYKDNVYDQTLVNIPGFDILGCGASETDFYNNGLDWGFVTQPLSGAANRRVRYARGKCISGSSARNYMIYQVSAVNERCKDGPDEVCLYSTASNEVGIGSMGQVDRR